MIGLYGILFSLAALRFASCTEKVALTAAAAIAPKDMTLKEELDWVHEFKGLYEHTKETCNAELQMTLVKYGITEEHTEMETALSEFLKSVDDLRTTILQGEAPEAPKLSIERPKNPYEKTVKNLLDKLPSLYHTLDSLRWKIGQWKEVKSNIDGTPLIANINKGDAAHWLKEQGFTFAILSKETTLKTLEAKVEDVFKDGSPFKKLVSLYATISSLNKPEKVVAQLVWLYMLSVSVENKIKEELKGLVEAHMSGKGAAFVNALKELSNDNSPLVEVLKASDTVLGMDAIKVARFTTFIENKGEDYLTLLAELFGTVEGDLADLNTLLRGKITVPNAGGEDARALGKKGLDVTKATGVKQPGFNYADLVAKYATLAQADGPLAKLGQLVKELAPHLEKADDDRSGSAGSSFTPIGVSVLMASVVAMLA